MSTLRETDDMPIPLDPAPSASNNMGSMHHHHHQDFNQPHPDEVARLKHETQLTDLNQVDHNEDESDNGSYNINNNLDKKKISFVTIYNMYHVSTSCTYTFTHNV